ncbi:rCG29382, partial [Rattus norvegicus]
MEKNLEGDGLWTLWKYVQQWESGREKKNDCISGGGTSDLLLFRDQNSHDRYTHGGQGPTVCIGCLV